MSFGLALLSSKANAAETSSTQFARVNYQNQLYWAQSVDSSQLQLLSDAPWMTPTNVADPLPLDEVEFEVPFTGTNVFAIGLNYRSHAGDSGAAKPEVFFKSPASLSLSDTLALSEDMKNLHFEGEMVLVIGKQCDAVSIEMAPECIFGYLAGNDLTERSWQSRDLQWWRAKGAKGFAPISQWVTTFSTSEPKFNVTTKLNGQIVQQESSSNMIHSSAAIVSFISQYIPLQAGDLIFTGTPGRTRALRASDQVSVEIEGIGIVTTLIE
ncbi:FAA hydrolase family protein [Alginatibacterium sediminis]|uniref:FAA hydrolase family protein n=2 Tax=Alginatibacterium sediminis TaxID=2164068 RepID=A0A420E5V6_9ALTE|nr:FAA hydrolase family protein [Alginatibacterium sediminis]